ncbi:MAG: archaetidylserine decarboxylase, partial [Lentisphaeria bacterium]
CSSDENELCSPADGRILVYPNVNENTLFPVKGAESRLADLCGEKMDNFIGGDVAVVRLCPADYHRFHFPCDGKIIKHYKVKGQYHSVNPVALKEIDNVFVRNKREVTILESKFGKIGYIEVGAFGVAGIEQTYSTVEVNKMDEKGYFKFGGSTVVLLFEPGRIEFCQDLLDKSSDGIEVLVKVGQALAFGK